MAPPSAPNGILKNPTHLNENNQSEQRRLCSHFSAYLQKEHCIHNGWETATSNEKTAHSSFANDSMANTSKEKKTVDLQWKWKQAFSQWSCNFYLSLLCALLLAKHPVHKQWLTWSTAGLMTSPGSDLLSWLRCSGLLQRPLAAPGGPRGTRFCFHTISNVLLSGYSVSFSKYHKKLFL